MANVLITGAAGFIGYNVILSDCASNSFTLVDNLANGEANSKSLIGIGHDLKLVDLRKDCISKLLVDVDIVIHLAAQGNVIDSIKDPISNLNSNTIATVRLLEAMRNSPKCNKIVFASTGGALMGNTRPPVDEDSTPVPISPYGASKLSCEAYIRAYSECYDIRSVILRFGNVYGRHSMHKKGVINKFTSAALANKEIAIFGDGSSTRDYIHVSDIARGIWSSVEYLLSGDCPNCEVLHLATGLGTSLNHLANEIIVATSSSSKLLKYSARKGEVEFNFASYKKAKQLISFEPSMTLSAGIRDFVDWYSSQLQEIAKDPKAY